MSEFFNKWEKRSKKGSTYKGNWKSFRLFGKQGENWSRGFAGIRETISQAKTILATAESVIDVILSFISILKRLELLLTNVWAQLLEKIWSFIDKILTDMENTGVYVLDLISYHFTYTESPNLCEEDLEKRRNAYYKNVLTDDSKFVEMLNDGKLPPSYHPSFITNTLGQWLYSDTDKGGTKDIPLKMTNIGWKKETYYEFMHVITSALKNDEDTVGYDKFLAGDMISSLFGEEKKAAAKKKAESIQNWQTISALDTFRTGRPAFNDNDKVVALLMVVNFPNLEDILPMISNMGGLFQVDIINGTGQQTKQIWEKAKQTNNPGFYDFFDNKKPFNAPSLQNPKAPYFYGISLKQLFGPFFKVMRRLNNKLYSLMVQEQIMNNSFVQMIEDFLNLVKEEIQNLIDVLDIIDDIFEILIAFTQLTGFRYVVLQTNHGTKDIIRQLSSLSPQDYFGSDYGVEYLQATKKIDYFLSKDEPFFNDDVSSLYNHTYTSLKKDTEYDDGKIKILSKEELTKEDDNFPSIADLEKITNFDSSNDQIPDTIYKIEYKKYKNKTIRISGKGNGHFDGVPIEELEIGQIVNKEEEKTDKKEKTVLDIYGWYEDENYGFISSEDKKIDKVKVSGGRAKREITSAYNENSRKYLNEAHESKEPPELRKQCYMGLMFLTVYPQFDVSSDDIESISMPDKDDLRYFFSKDNVKVWGKEGENLSDTWALLESFFEEDKDKRKKKKDSSSNTSEEEEEEITSTNSKTNDVDTIRSEKPPKFKTPNPEEEYIESVSISSDSITIKKPQLDTKLGGDANKYFLSIVKKEQEGATYNIKENENDEKYRNYYVINEEQNKNILNESREHFTFNNLEPYTDYTVYAIAQNYFGGILKRNRFSTTQDFSILNSTRNRTQSVYFKEIIFSDHFNLAINHDNIKISKPKMLNNSGIPKELKAYIGKANTIETFETEEQIVINNVIDEKNFIEKELIFNNLEPETEYTIILYGKNETGGTTKHIKTQTPKYSESNAPIIDGLDIKKVSATNIVLSLPTFTDSFPSSFKFYIGEKSKINYDILTGKLNISGDVLNGENGQDIIPRYSNGEPSEEELEFSGLKENQEYKIIATAITDKGAQSFAILEVPTATAPIIEDIDIIEINENSISLNKPSMKNTPSPQATYKTYIGLEDLYINKEESDEELPNNYFVHNILQGPIENHERIIINNLYSGQNYKIITIAENQVGFDFIIKNSHTKKRPSIEPLKVYYLNSNKIILHEPKFSDKGYPSHDLIDIYLGYNGEITYNINGKINNHIEKITFDTSQPQPIIFDNLDEFTQYRIVAVADNGLGNPTIIDSSLTILDVTTNADPENEDNVPELEEISISSITNNSIIVNKPTLTSSNNNDIIDVFIGKSDEMVLSDELLEEYVGTQIAANKYVYNFEKQQTVENNNIVFNNLNNENQYTIFAIARNSIDFNEEQGYTLNFISNQELKHGPIIKDILATSTMSKILVQYPILSNKGYPEANIEAYLGKNITINNGDVSDAESNRTISPNETVIFDELDFNTNYQLVIKAINEHSFNIQQIEIETKKDQNIDKEKLILPNKQLDSKQYPPKILPLEIEELTYQNVKINEINYSTDYGEPNEFYLYIGFKNSLGLQEENNKITIIDNISDPINILEHEGTIEISSLYPSTEYKIIAIANNENGTTALTSEFETKSSPSNQQIENIQQKNINEGYIDSNTPSPLGSDDQEENKLEKPNIFYAPKQDHITLDNIKRNFNFDNDKFLDVIKMILITKKGNAILLNSFQTLYNDESILYRLFAYPMTPDGELDTSKTTIDLQIIDRRLYFDKDDNLLYTAPIRKDEYWISYIEKAIAKSVNGYENLKDNSLMMSTILSKEDIAFKLTGKRFNEIKSGSTILRERIDVSGNLNFAARKTLLDQEIYSSDQLNDQIKKEIINNFLITNETIKNFIETYSSDLVNIIPNNPNKSSNEVIDLLKQQAFQTKYVSDFNNNSTIQTNINNNQELNNIKNILINEINNENLNTLILAETVQKEIFLNDLAQSDSFTPDEINTINSFAEDNVKDIINEFIQQKIVETISSLKNNLENYFTDNEHLSLTTNDYNDIKDFIDNETFNQLNSLTNENKNLFFNIFKKIINNTNALNITFFSFLKEQNNNNLTLEEFINEKKNKFFNYLIENSGGVNVFADDVSSIKEFLINNKITNSSEISKSRIESWGFSPLQPAKVIGTNIINGEYDFANENKDFYIQNKTYDPLPAIIESKQLTENYNFNTPAKATGYKDITNGAELDNQQLILIFNSTTYTVNFSGVYTNSNDIINEINTILPTDIIVDKMISSFNNEEYLTIETSDGGESISFYLEGDALESLGVLNKTYYGSNKSFIINGNNFNQIKISLIDTNNTLNDIINQINQQFENENIDTEVIATNDNNKLIIKTIATGYDNFIEIEHSDNIENSILTLFDIIPGKYDGKYGEIIHINLTEKVNDKNSLITYLNELLTDEIIAYSYGNYIGFKTIYEGAQYSFELTPGNNDVLTVFGVLSGIYIGQDESIEITNLKIEVDNIGQHFVEQNTIVNSFYNTINKINQHLKNSYNINNDKKIKLNDIYKNRSKIIYEQLLDFQHDLNTLTEEFNIMKEINNNLINILDHFNSEKEAIIYSKLRSYMTDGYGMLAHVPNEEDNQTKKILDNLENFNLYTETEFIIFSVFIDNNDQKYIVLKDSNNETDTNLTEQDFQLIDEDPNLISLPLKYDENNNPILSDYKGTFKIDIENFKKFDVRAL